MKRLVKHRFTLAELLVSMAVFSILLVLMMQFFSGARTLWTANEKRAAIYADATTAMDLMSMLLQSTIYSCDIPFALTGSAASATSDAPRVSEDSAIKATDIDGWNSMIYFISNSPLELSKGGSMRYLCFQRKTDTSVAGVFRNILEIKVFSDSSNPNLKFDQCFVPFGPAVSADNKVEQARDHLGSKVFNVENALTAQEKKIILRNVTGLKFTPVDHTGKMIYGANCYGLPAGIEIELSLMENEQTIRDYQALETKALRDEFRLKNEYTFRRTIWLGDRTVRL